MSDGNYAPFIPTIGWDNSYSLAFVDLLSILAAANVVIAAGARVVVAADAACGRRAKQLLTQELVARLGTGSLAYSPDWDPLIDVGYCPVGPQIADDFAARAPGVTYRGSGVNRYSVAMPRNGRPDKPEFVQADAVAAYASELAAVLAAIPQLAGDVATQATKNTAVDPTTAATAATALTTSRAAYVSSLSAQYPTRGYA